MLDKQAEGLTELWVMSPIEQAALSQINNFIGWILNPMQSTQDGQNHGYDSQQGTVLYMMQFKCRKCELDCLVSFLLELSPCY